MNTIIGIAIGVLTIGFGLFMWFTIRVINKSVDNLGEIFKIIYKNKDDGRT